ncbi:MAG: prenyltransferase [Clostridia bacterium]|nr:prenyltransferase [Clostridia bacterium]
MEALLKAVWRSWRPFSLTAAIIPTTLGSVIALLDGRFDMLTFILVTIGGLLIQSGVNLINDFFEFKSGILPEKNPHLKLTFNNRLLFEYLIFLAGLGCFALTVPIGLYLTYKSGLQLLIIGFIGFIGGYFYTGKPFSYKDKALGVILVFFLMGVLMVYGSYYAFTSHFSLYPVIISVPVSLLVSLLLISNEIRDIESDTHNGLRTLSVLIGYKNAVRMYLGVLISAYLTIPIFTATGILPAWCLLAFTSLPYGLKTYSMLTWELPHRRIIVPRTANIHFMFGVLLIAGILISRFLS